MIPVVHGNAEIRGLEKSAEMSGITLTEIRGRVPLVFTPIRTLTKLLMSTKIVYGNIAYFFTRLSRHWSITSSSFFISNFLTQCTGIFF